MDIVQPLYLGVVGKPAFHSLSPPMHTAVMKKLGIKGSYLPFEVDDFEKAVIGAMGLGFRGLNVTMPYKEEAYRLADEVSDDVKIVKAGNTILFECGRIKVFNTDIYGFSESIKKAGFSADGKRVAVIGAGGAARSIVYSLVVSGAKVIHIFNRTYEKAVKIKEDIESCVGEKITIEVSGLNNIDFEDFDIIVNATNIGWNNENLYEVLGVYPRRRPKNSKSDKLFFDTIYVPTKFIAIARELGYSFLDGKWMLVLQGAMSFKIWTSVYPNENVMMKALNRAIKERYNQGRK